MRGFPEAEKFIGADLNRGYRAELGQAPPHSDCRQKTQLVHGNFFTMNWSSLVSHLPKPLLILANPPWVTSSDLGPMRSANSRPS